MLSSKWTTHADVRMLLEQLKETGIEARWYGEMPEHCPECGADLQWWDYFKQLADRELKDIDQRKRYGYGSEA